LLVASVVLACRVGGMVEGSTLTVANHADTPVYATAVTVPVATLYNNTGIAAGTPVAFTLSTGSRVPAFPGNDNGVPVVRAFVSLAAGQQLAMQLQPTAAWDSPAAVCSASFNPATRTARIANGVVALDYDANGRWVLTFDGPMAAAVESGNRILIRNCRFDAWLDTEDRGRLQNIDPAPLGLVHVDSATLLEGQARVNADGSVELILRKGFAGLYSDVVLTETFTLLPGQPVVTYRTVFQNNGVAPRYVAYVDNGGVLRGNYGNLLSVQPMVKYEDPNSPAMVLLSGPSNSFLRVAWRSEKCWLGIKSGSGCGIGFSTTTERRTGLAGSTVWWASRNDFFICLVDAEQTEPTNFPFLIRPGAMVDHGLAIVANCGDTNMWSQSRQLFSAVTTGKTPRLNNAYTAYLGGQALLAAQVESFAGPAGMQATGALRSTALDIDFRAPYNLTLNVGQASAQNPLVVRARAMDNPAETHVVLTADTIGSHVVDFTAATGWLGSRKAFTLELDESSGATASVLALGRAPLPAPELNSPAHDASITDIAANFRWRGVEGVLDYELQLASDSGFTAPVTIAVQSEIAWPFFLPTDTQLPGAGTWYWRVRAMADGIGGEWSVPFRIQVSTDRSTQPLVHTITPERPLFTFEGWQVNDWSRFANTIPADIRPYMAFTSALKFDLIEGLRPLRDNGYRAMIRTHHPSPITGWTPLAEVEAVFQAYPNVVGIIGGETLDSLYAGGLRTTYAMRLLQLCAKYGRIYYEADGTYTTNKWEELYARNGEFLQRYRDYLVLAQKNNIHNRQFVSQSSALGLYLAGEIAHHGSWEDGGWYWQQVGFQELGEMFGSRGGDVRLMPRNFWNLTFLMGIARGCAIFSFDGQAGVARVGDTYSIANSGMPASASRAAYMSSQGELTPVFHRYIAPFIRGVLNHNLVPSKAQVMEQVRLAVYNDGVPVGSNPDPYYYQYKALYEGSYGFRDIGVYPGTLMEFFPNAGRYAYFPLLPQGRIELGQGIETVPLSQLMDPAQVRTRFNAAYPQRYQGDALVHLVGDTLAVLNSNENLDERQSYQLPLANRGQFAGIAGTVEPHAYLMGKFSERNRRLWLQANAEYADRNTQLVVTCTREPLVITTPANALVVSQWNAATGDLHLTLSHADGAVEVMLSHPDAVLTGEQSLAEFATSIATPADGGGGPVLWYADFASATANGHMDNRGSAGATPATHQAYRLGAQSYADTFGNPALAYGIAPAGTQSAAVAGSTGLFTTGAQGTVSLLFRTPHDLSGLKVLFQQGSGFELAIDGASARLTYTRGGLQQAYIGSPLAAATWYYVALRWDTTRASGDLTWYLGQAGGRTLESGQLSMDVAGGNAAIMIGGRATSHLFAGPLQHLAVWQRELTDSAIRSIFGATIVPQRQLLIEVSLEKSTDQRTWEPADTGVHDTSAGPVYFRPVITPLGQP
jgi:hypothetical protein